MRFILNSLLILLFSAQVAFGQTVGVSSFAIAPNDKTLGFSVRLWYPTDGGVAQRFGASRIRPGYLAVQDASPALTEQAPLVVLNHGSGGSAESMAWIAIGLARRGALVVAADHPASSGGNPERQSILQVWTQPRDVSHLLDQLLTSVWRERIGVEKIAVVGFSLGGATAMSLAGARLQFERFPAFCEKNSDGACSAFRQHFAGLDQAFYDRANADLVDSRIGVAVAIAPGFSESLTTESLQALTTPLLLIAGESDQQLPPQTHIYPIRPYLPRHSRYSEISEAQHFSFLPLCGEGAIEVLAETNEEFVCLEVGSKSREDIHAETLQNITDFLVVNGILE
jgi:predicted dienelactone hydrolase